MTTKDRPKLLDLFCGAGGAAMGYYRAGFDVVGVDIKPMPRYPFEFIRVDAIDMLRRLLYGGFLSNDCNWYFLADFAAIHASPPCQKFSTMTKRWKRQDEHPDLIDSIRQLLIKTGLPYVIENVEGAPLINPVMLCGSMFGLGTKEKYICKCGYSFDVNLGKYGCASCEGDNVAALSRKKFLKRHRLFEASFDLWPPATCAHIGHPVAVYGHSGGSSKRDGLTFGGIDIWRAAMQIDWMTGDELAEAIPPAYTEFIGKHLMQALQVTK